MLAPATKPCHKTGTWCERGKKGGSGLQPLFPPLPSLPCLPQPYARPSSLRSARQPMPIPSLADRHHGERNAVCRRVPRSLPGGQAVPRHKLRQGVLCVCALVVCVCVCMCVCVCDLDCANFLRALPLASSRQNIAIGLLRPPLPIPLCQTLWMAPRSSRPAPLCSSRASPEGSSLRRGPTPLTLSRHGCRCVENVCVCVCVYVCCFDVHAAANPAPIHLFLFHPLTLCRHPLLTLSLPPGRPSPPASPSMPPCAAPLLTSTEREA